MSKEQVTAARAGATKPEGPQQSRTDDTLMGAGVRIRPSSVLRIASIALLTLGVFGCSPEGGGGQGTNNGASSGSGTPVDLATGSGR